MLKINEARKSDPKFRENIFAKMRKFRKDVFTKKNPRVVAATNNCAKKIMEFSRNDPVLNCGNLHDSSPRKA